MLQSILRTIFVFLLTIILVPVPLMAEPPSDKGKPGKAGKELRKAEHEQEGSLDWSLNVSVGISLGEARQLAVNHGLTGVKPLPPGIRKNLTRGKPMPPGIARNRMPDAFLNQLPYHEGYEWHWSGSDLVLVVVGTLVITHVLADVFE